MKHRICIVAPFSGVLPRHSLALYFHSCAHNPGIDVLMFADAPETLGPDVIPPPNVRLVPFTLAEFNARASQALGCPVNVPNGQKLCDYRPMFGEIFREQLVGYDFWGQCDLDLVFGDLSAALTESVLTAYDVISLRREWISGPLCLYRNTKEINSLFRRSPDWQRVATSQNYWLFDESGRFRGNCEATHPALARGESILDLDLETDNMTALLERIQGEKGAPRVFRETLVKESLGPGMVLKYDAGTLRIVASRTPRFPLGSTYAHYHYVTEKRNPGFVVPYWPKVPERYYIDDLGFYTEEEFEHRHGRLRCARRLRGAARFMVLKFPGLLVRSAKRRLRALR